MEAYSTIFQELAYKYLFLLKIDMRTKCFFYLDYMRFSNYYLMEDSSEPEIFIKKFNQDIERHEAWFSSYMSRQKADYIFNGIGNLVCEILLNILPRMKCKLFNANGINLIKKNIYIFFLQQNLANYVDASELAFGKASDYWDYLKLTEKELMQLVYRDNPYSLAQFKAILNAEGPKRNVNETAIQTSVELWSSKY